MDTSEYDTNSILINSISSIEFRIFEPSPDLSQAHPSAALEIENTLREGGHVVFYDNIRRAIWQFRVLAKGGKPEFAKSGLDNRIEITGYTLLIVEEGILEPASLQKGRAQAHPSSNTPTSSSSSGSAFDPSQRQVFPTASQGPASHPTDQESKVQGSSGVDLRSGRPSHKTVYENFIAALLLTISSAFCRETGALPLNYRTMLLSPHFCNRTSSHDISTEPEAVLGTLSSYLTTGGSLVISFAISLCHGLTSAQDAVATSLTSSGHRVITAPFGVVANNQLATYGETGTTGPVQTPNTQPWSLRAVSDPHESVWRQTCIRILQMRGIATSSLTGCCWINLSLPKLTCQDTKPDVRRHHVPDPTISVSWPGPLCFRKKSVEISSTSRVGDTLLSGHDETHDPLGNAKGWFASAAEREDKLSKRKAARVIATSQDAKGVEFRAPKPNSHSPLALRRPSATAAGAMYPTPPDAIQQPSGVTPSLDGTLSSPGNPLSAAAAPELESVALQTTGDAFNDASDFAESKRQRSESNLLGEPDNVFGDMTGDMFDENDITEADFSFFDEQPGALGLDLAMGEASEATPSEKKLITAPQAQDNSKAAVGLVTTQPSAQHDSAVFAKPELKHARSSRNDDATQQTRDIRTGSTKRESSPFDPQTVFKRVRASLATTSCSPHGLASGLDRKIKIFEKIDFDPTLPMINRKYEQGGLFDFGITPSSPEKARLSQATLPKTDYLKRHGKQNRKLKGHRLPSRSLVKGFTGPEPRTSNSSPIKGDDSISDGDDSSMESDQDDSSYTSEDPPSPLKSSVKMTSADEDNVPQGTPLRAGEHVEEQDQQLAIEVPRLSKPESPELPLAALFSDPEPVASEMPLSDDELVQIAQILTEQAATGNLDLSSPSSDAAGGLLASQKRQALSADARSAIDVLGDVIPRIVGYAAPVRLKELLDVQDMPIIGQPNRLQPRPIPGRDPNAEPIRPSNIYQIPCPHLEVRRSDMKLSILPPAVTFWESLGLAPASGTKNASAVCVFPGWSGLADNVRTFLGRVKSLYEVLKLGSFESLALSPDLEDGILPYEVDRISTSPGSSITGYGSALVESVEILRVAISNLTTMGTNIVIYFVYSPNNPGTIIEACTAFQRLFESYQKLLATKRESAANEMVLQLVSADMLSSPTSMVVTPTPALGKLCMETYDRCTLFGGPMPAPAIRLEQPLPRIIDFKLTNSPSASLIRENSCIHVAYAQSVDDRWVTAAWTDDRGNQQATASYCLGRKGRATSRSMNEIAHEIWESTLDLVSVWKVHWRVIITKCAPMDQQEMEFWADLARTEIKASVTMILMTVDTTPSLQLIPPLIKLSPSSLAPLYTTPVSTPQATNIVSPEQSATPVTPARDPHGTAMTPGADAAGEPDSESFLADATDQTWGSVVGHRLSNSVNVLEVHPALISGYLIKRTGTKMEDAPVAMEVNLVHTEASPRAYEPLLREMLSYFRGLGTLARARGVVEREADVRPWHVAAAEKAVRVLYLLL